MKNIDDLIKQTDLLAQEIKRLNKIGSKVCRTCEGRGYFLDSTYDRAGINVSCGVCYGTGLHKKQVDKIIIETFKKYSKKIPK